jgi:hypothetical protein
MKYIGPPQSGSKEATVASRNRYGQYFRTRAIPTNPDTTFQRTVRSRLGSLSASWRSLAEAHRTDWRDAARQIPLQDSLGQTYYMTGMQYYISANALRLQMGLILLTTPYTGGPTTEPPTQVNVTATDVGDVTVKLIGLTAGTEKTICIESTPPVSPGRLYAAGYRFLKAATQTEISTDMPVGTQFVERFGTPVAGQRITIRFRHIVSGREFWSVTASAVVTPD